MPRAAKSAPKKFNAASSSPPAQLKLDREAIATNPADLKSIATFGAAQTAALNSVATRMIKVQGNFNDAVNGMTTALERLAGDIQQLDPTSGNAAPHKITESFRAVMDALVATEAQKKAAQDIARDHTQIAQELRHYIAAVPALLDDYRKKFIPAATSPADKSTLEKRTEDLGIRLTVLEGARSASLIAGQQVKLMLETMDDMINGITPMLRDMKDVYQSAKLDYEQKEAARLLAEAIEIFTEGTAAPVTIKKPLQFKPKT